MIGEGDSFPFPAGQARGWFDALWNAVAAIDFVTASCAHFVSYAKRVSGDDVLRLSGNYKIRTHIRAAGFAAQESPAFGLLSSFPVVARFAGSAAREGCVPPFLSSVTSGVQVFCSPSLPGAIKGTSAASGVAIRPSPTAPPPRASKLFCRR